MAETRIRLAELEIRQDYITYFLLSDYIEELESEDKLALVLDPVKINGKAIVDGHHRFWAHVCHGLDNILFKKTTDNPTVSSQPKTIELRYEKEESDIDKTHLDKITSFCAKRNIEVICKRDPLDSEKLCEKN